MRRISLPKRIRRHRRIRSKVFGTASRPRLAAFRSTRYIYAQIINDEKGETLASVSTKEMKGKTPLEKAKEAGKEIAAKAKEKGVGEVSFDRGGFLYSGRIKSLAEGAREGGLKF